MRYFLLLGSALATTLTLRVSDAIAGPGGSGGNPTLSVASMTHDYLFSAPPPAHTTTVSDVERFDFGLGGFQLEIHQIPYDASRCVATNAVKTVCPGSGSNATVVLRDHATFSLTFIDNGIGKDRIGLVAAAIVQSFVQASPASQTSLQRSSP